MKLVDYENEKLGVTIEKEIPEGSAIPAEITVEGRVYKRVWNFSGGGIHIPIGFNPTNNPIRTDQRASKRKVF